MASVYQKSKYHITPSPRGDVGKTSVGSGILALSPKSFLRLHVLHVLKTMSCAVWDTVPCIRIVFLSLTVFSSVAS